MKKLQFLGAALSLALPIILIGCGGGGSSGGPSPNPTSGPRATATPRSTPPPPSGSRVLVVQLRDSAGRVVDGIVTVGTLSLPTSGGNVSFSGLGAGGVNVSAEVDGVITTKPVTVQNTGTTTVAFVVAPAVTPAPPAPLPPPPF